MAKQEINIFNHRHLPTCPHCGTEHVNWEEFGFDHDEETIEVECWECGKPFLATLYVTNTFTTRKKEETDGDKSAS